MVKVSTTLVTASGVSVKRDIDYILIGIRIVRRSSGVVIRLIGPIVILLILSGYCVT